MRDETVLCVRILDTTQIRSLIAFFSPSMYRFNVSMARRSSLLGRRMQRITAGSPSVKSEDRPHISTGPKSCGIVFGSTEPPEELKSVSETIGTHVDPKVISTRIAARFVITDFFTPVGEIRL